eukprot:362110-Chlamydomonas_euryale.AAC.13
MCIRDRHGRRKPRRGEAADREAAARVIARKDLRDRLIGRLLADKLDKSVADAGLPHAVGHPRRQLALGLAPRDDAYDADGPELAEHG